MYASFVLMQFVACKPPPPGTFIGSVGSLESEIGLVTNATGGRVYVAGGLLTMVDHHAWFDVKIDKNKLEGSSKADKLDLEAKGDAGAWRGTLTDTDGSGQTVILFPPDQANSGGTTAGLDGVYEAESDSLCPVGAIVYGDAKYLQGVYCGQDGTFHQLTVVGELADADPNAIQVTADTDPPTELTLSPAAP